MLPLGTLASSRVASGGGGGTLTFVGSAAAATSTTSHSIGIPLGTASSDRVIIVAISGQPTAASAIAIDGNAMAVDNSHLGEFGTATYICRLAVPTGTTGTLTLTTSASVSRIGVGVWAVTGTAPTVQATGTGESANLTALAGDFAIAAKYANVDPVWSGTTEQYDGIYVGSDRYTGAHVVVASSGTVSPRVTGGYPNLGFASVLYRF